MNKDLFEKMVRDKEKNSYEICDKLAFKPVVVLPAGRLYKISICTLLEWGIRVVAAGDKDPEKALNNGKPWKNKGVDITVEKTSEIIKKYGNNVNYVVYSSYFRDEITKELMTGGIEAENIFSIPVLMGGLVPKNSFRRTLEIRKRFDEIQKAASLLADDESRNQLWEILSVFCANAPVWISKEATEEYFNTPYFSLGHEETFVDAGMYDGKTSARFAELCPDYKDIYGIEANPANFDMINETLKGLERVHLFNNAISNKNCELSFKREGIGPEGARLSQDGEIVVKGIIGDEMGISPTIIKFDVEGAEYDAILGFKETIKRCNPKMAISAYHSLEDHWRLINLVKDICPEYKLYLNHHYGYEVMYGTVLYASVE